MHLEQFILIGGLLHFGILLASGLVPKVLDWNASLHTLDRLLRQLVWVHGAFIVLVIAGFGTISVLLSAELAAGTPLARAMCGFVAVFWTARLAVQLFVFDAAPHMNRGWLKAGYHGLTLVFAYHAVVYSWAALAG